MNDLCHFKPIEDMPTPLALTTVDAAGGPSVRRYGEAPGTVVDALAADLERAVQESGALAAAQACERWGACDQGFTA